MQLTKDDFPELPHYQHSALKRLFKRWCAVVYGGNTQYKLTPEMMFEREFDYAEFQSLLEGGYVSLPNVQQLNDPERFKVLPTSKGLAYCVAHDMTQSAAVTVAFAKALLAQEKFKNEGAPKLQKALNDLLRDTGFKARVEMDSRDYLCVYVHSGRFWVMTVQQSQSDNNSPMYGKALGYIRPDITADKFTLGSIGQTHERGVELDMSTVAEKLRLLWEVVKCVQSGLDARDESARVDPVEYTKKEAHNLDSSLRYAIATWLAEQP